MSEPKNIWMLTKWYPNREDPQFGVFIQKHVRVIGRHNRISVLYIHSTTKISSTFEIEEKENSGIHEVIVYFRRQSTTLGKIINLFRFLIALNKGILRLKVKNPRPEIIHSYILLRTGIVAWFLSRRRKIPFVISEQWSGYLTGNFLKSSLIRQYLSRKLVKKASAVSSVSKFLFNRMQDCGLKNSNFHIIPNIIEIPPDRKNSESPFVRVLVVADLVDEIKNISGLIRMISELPEDLHFQLKIIGHGKDEATLKKLASSFNLLNTKIFFEGLKTNEGVYQYLLDSDFLVMNSLYETFSLICAEAMSCGKPVLATRCGGPNEFITAETGILTEPGNKSELKKNFLFMLANHRSFNPVIIREYVQNLFSQSKVSQDFQRFYESIVKK